MNQTCKVCDEPAAGFHFGAFTCEGCKSFFGRSYNNLSSISECKNNGECVINKKNRTACKACRLRKCLLVGMSKGGSRYGRRSNWFKIHCLLQEQQKQAEQASQNRHGHQMPSDMGPTNFMMGSYPTMMFQSKDDENKRMKISQSIGSPNSQTSENGIMRISEKTSPQEFSPHISHKDHLFRPVPFSGLNSFPVMPNSAFLPPNLMFGGYHPAIYQNYFNLINSSSDRYPSGGFLSGSSGANIDKQSGHDKDSERGSPNSTNSLPYSIYPLGHGQTNDVRIKSLSIDSLRSTSDYPSASTPTRSERTTPTTTVESAFDTLDREIDITTNAEDDMVDPMTRLQSPSAVSELASCDEQDDPIDLSMKTSSSTNSSTTIAAKTSTTECNGKILSREIATDVGADRAQKRDSLDERQYDQQQQREDIKRRRINTSSSFNSTTNYGPELNMSSMRGIFLCA